MTFIDFHLPEISAFLSNQTKHTKDKTIAHQRIFPLAWLSKPLTETPTFLLCLQEESTQDCCAEQSMPKMQCSGTMEKRGSTNSLFFKQSTHWSILRALQGLLNQSKSLVLTFLIDIKALTLGGAFEFQINFIDVSKYLLTYC